MNTTDIEKDITGQWWSGDYLLTVKNGKVYFDTNIGTEHTPFYDNRIFEENLSLQFEGNSSSLCISQNLTIVEYKPNKETLLIAFNVDRVVLQLLKRYTGKKEII